MRKINVTLKKSELTPEIVKELITYRPQDGSFFWNRRDHKWFLNELPESFAIGYCARWNATHANQRIIGDKVKLLGVTYRLADLAYFIMRGYWSTTYKRTQNSLAWRNFYD